MCVLGARFTHRLLGLLNSTAASMYTFIMKSSSEGCRCEIRGEEKTPEENSAESKSSIQGAGEDFGQSKALNIKHPAFYEAVYISVNESSL